MKYALIQSCEFGQPSLIQQADTCTKKCLLQSDTDVGVQSLTGPDFADEFPPQQAGLLCGFTHQNALCHSRLHRGMPYMMLTHSYTLQNLGHAMAHPPYVLPIQHMHTEDLCCT